jgi:hypothetical protein
MGCLAPDYQVPEPFTFRIFSEADSLRVETNLDFDAANESYHRFFPDSSLDSALLIAQIYEGGATLRLAAEDSDELALSPECSVVATAKFATILQKRGMSDTEIGLFQEWVFSEGRAIREAVNAGHRNFEDVLQLVERGKEFKEWVADQPDDSNLRKEYCIAVTKVGWADKLQVRATRWALLVGASEAIAAMTTPIVGGTSGIAMSAANSFLVDKLIKGWRPNQFVAGPLRTFVDKSVNHAP